VEFDLFGRKKRKEESDRRLMETLIRQTLSSWPAPSTQHDLRRMVGGLSDFEFARILDKTRGLGYIIESNAGFYPNNAHLALDFEVVRCPTCGEVHQVKELLRPGGMGNELLVCIYCDRDPTLVVFQLDQPVPTEMLGPSSDGWGGDVERRMEERLRPCPCGGSFRFEAPLICPKCKGVLATGRRSQYYFAIGRVLDGGRDPIWK